MEAATTLEDLRRAESEVLGKRSQISSLNQRLGQLPPAERKEAGRAVNEARDRLESLARSRAERLEKQERAARLEAERLDLAEVLPGPRRGHLHLVTQTRDELEDVFVGLGYTVAEGPEVETDWHNFEALNMPVAHPARSNFDTLYVDWGTPASTLLRTHTSPVQIRVMQDQPPPIYSIMPGRVYRKDTPDARHTPSFSQIEGLVVDRAISFGDLAGTIEVFTGAYFGPNIHSRLRPGYFPFTEPSAEFEITCTICEGSGCRTCSGTGWIELGGCGMVHPNVFGAVGVDPEEWSGFAFGFGIDRCAQMRHGISDMRVLLDNDIRFISQF
ncbi:MAG TPA: phenylalanine--tRNA ligase subunit alpha [bacterium]|nr:phenylalanine--tRNA ligase subunit alpha [bacterium]